MLTGKKQRVRRRADSPLPLHEKRASTGQVYGAALRWLREFVELDQVQFAERARMDQGTISRLEKGQTILALHHIDRYTQVLGFFVRNAPPDEETGLHVSHVCRAVEVTLWGLHKAGYEVDWQGGVIAKGTPPLAEEAQELISRVMGSLFRRPW